MLGFICTSFSSFLDEVLGCLFRLILVFEDRLVMIWTLLLLPLLSCPKSLDMLYYHCHLFLCISWSLFLFLPRPSYSSVACHLIFTYLWFSSLSFYSWSLISKHYDQKIWLVQLQSSYICWGYLSVPYVFDSWECSMCTREEYKQLFWDGRLCKCQLCPICLMCHLRMLFPYQFSVWMICPYLTVGYLVSLLR
mgnify:CR=1 FL=1